MAWAASRALAASFPIRGTASSRRRCARATRARSSTSSRRTVTSRPRRDRSRGRAGLGIEVQLVLLDVELAAALEARPLVGREEHVRDVGAAAGRLDEERRALEPAIAHEQPVAARGELGPLARELVALGHGA